ncbi:MAG: hypothetical protein KAH26_09050 [Bacteroidales bacterium]|nr:hypothetical protein [Bacteroidales bacterium]
MENKALLDEIAKNNIIIDYHLEKLKKKPDDLHEIDIDMLGDKLKETYSLILELQPGKPEKEAAIPVEKEEIIVTEVKEAVVVVEEKVQPEPIAESVPEPEPDPEPKPEHIEPVAEDKTVVEAEMPEPPANPNPGPVAETPETIVATEEPEPDVAPDEETGEEPAPKTTADLFSGSPTIADSFQSEKDNSIAAMVSPQSVQDLKMAIGINDKFLFINDLFNGDPPNYNDAIEKLNLAEDAQEAMKTLDGFGEQLGWTDRSEAFGRLRKIVQSKYS